MSRYVLKKKPGEVMQVTLFRGDQKMTVAVELGERPDYD